MFILGFHSLNIFTALKQLAWDLLHRDSTLYQLPYSEYAAAMHSKLFFTRWRRL